MKYYLKWTNKYSKETGYVEKISTKNQCFYNSFDTADARRFRSEKEAQNIIAKLEEYGEAENNEFEVISEE